MADDTTNGTKEAITELKRRMGEAEHDIKELRDSIPPKVKCDFHDAELGEIKADLKGVRGDMKDFATFRDKTSVWLIVIAVAANLLVGTLTVSAVRHFAAKAFAQEAH